MRFFFIQRESHIVKYYPPLANNGFFFLIFFNERVVGCIKEMVTIQLHFLLYNILNYIIKNVKTKNK